MSSASQEKLQRTLELPAITAIGVGTMVGAGIFIFPGIAVNYAGPAAVLSFGLAGFIALLVALCTAELATAMPNNGGAYYFVSRAMGPDFGIFVGIGQWLGLVFASSFYLVGFAQYFIELLQETGLSIGSPEVLVASGLGVFLTILNLVGTKKVGKLQNSIVVTLAAILLLIFAYGLVENLGLSGAESSWPKAFASEGTWPIFTTTALIFTSFLGFVQIATVAGEVKEPHRNLPRALIGSVLIVTFLYVTAVFVSVITLPVAELSAAGEQAMVLVAEQIVGPVGGMAILLAALLATASSANASILSSSRAVFALSRDRMIPEFASKINQRFGTPHVSVLLVGVSISLLTLLGDLEVLAEVASLLHLIFYGLICLSLILLRKRKPVWFTPTFTSPGGWAIPVMGTAASFALIFMMQTLSLLIGLGILTLSGIWYLVYARHIELSDPMPPHIIPQLRAPHILLPVEFPNPEAPPLPLFSAFSRLKLFVLGITISPDQVSPEQSSEKIGQERREQLEAYLDNISFENIEIEQEFVFTSNYSTAISSYLEGQNIHALLVPKKIDVLNRLLVPLYRKDQINTRLATILRELSLAAKLPVSFVFLKTKAKDETKVDLDLLERLGQQKLEQAGVPSSQIQSQHTEADDIVDAVKQFSEDEDLIIISESKDEERERWFSAIHDDIQATVDCPTLMIFQGEAR